MSGVVAGAVVTGALGAVLLLERSRARRRHLRLRLDDTPASSSPAAGAWHGWRARRRRAAACAQVPRVVAELVNDARTGRPLDLSGLPRPLAQELHARPAHAASDEVALLAFALRVAAVPGASGAQVFGVLAERLEARAAADDVARGMARAAHAGLAALALAPLGAWVADGARPEVAPWAWLGAALGMVVALRAFPGGARA